MKIYSISGFCPDTEDGEAHIVHEVHSSRENAEIALKELIEGVREQAGLIEDAKGIGNCKGIWTETFEGVITVQHKGEKRQHGKTGYG